MGGARGHLCWRSRGEGRSAAHPQPALPGRATAEPPRWRGRGRPGLPGRLPFRRSRRPRCAGAERRRRSPHSRATASAHLLAGGWDAAPLPPFKNHLYGGFRKGAIPGHLRGSGCAGAWAKRPVLVLIPRRGKRGCGAATPILPCRGTDGAGGALSSPIAHPPLPARCGALPEPGPCGPHASAGCSGPRWATRPVRGGGCV